MGLRREAQEKTSGKDRESDIHEIWSWKDIDVKMDPERDRHRIEKKITE